MEKIIYSKVDTVFIYKITPKKLYAIENDFEMYEELMYNNDINLHVILKVGEKLNEVKISDVIKEIILNKRPTNHDLIDFVFYIASITNKNIIDNLKNYKKIEKVFDEFIIHLSKFRESQIIKYTFNINQRRISRKQLMKIKEEIKSFARVNWTAEDIF